MYGPFTVLSRKDQYPKCKWVAMPRIYSITYPQVQACLEWLQLPIRNESVHQQTSHISKVQVYLEWLQLPVRDEFVLWQTFDSIQRHAWLPWWRLGIIETTSRGCRCYRRLTVHSHILKTWCFMTLESLHDTLSLPSPVLQMVVCGHVG